VIWSATQEPRSRTFRKANDAAAQAFERGGWIVVGASLLALVVLRVPLGPLGSLDILFLQGINATMAQLPWIGFQTQLFNAEITQLVIAAVAVALWFRRSANNIFRARLLLAFVSLFPTYGLARILQHLGHRMRPMIDQALQPLGDPAAFNSVRAQMSHWGSFPSDHSAMLAIATLVAFMVGQRIGFIVLILSLYSCLFRIGYGYHWPSDIAGGIILGTAFCLLALRLQRTLRPTFTKVFSFIERRPGISAAIGTIVVTEFSDGFRYSTFVTTSLLRTRLFH
jgi:membrane-associated phospholipid phosphatase